MNDHFKCDFCGHEFKTILGILRGDKRFCSHKHEVYYKVWAEKEAIDGRPFPDYPDRSHLEV